MRTGAPITVHTNPHTESGLVAQRVLAEEGADLGKVVVGHSGDTTDVDYLCRVADAGSYLGMDRFGLDVLLPFEDRVATVRRRLDAAGIPHLDNPSHIIPVMVGNAHHAKMISDWLMDNHGIYVQPINYPTVPKGTERLRITPSPVHTDGDIDRLVRALSDCWSMCELARVPMAA